MKTKSILIFAAFVAVIFSSCEGPEGEPGTANVIYSEWSVLDGAWRDSTFSGANFKVNHLNATALTQDIIDAGVVICYQKYLGNVVALPYTCISYTIAFHPNPNRILFTTLKNDLSGGVVLSSNHYYRYVIIPGGISAKSTLDYSKLRYEDLCYVLYIPE